jgi:hypothetical protein
MRGIYSEADRKAKVDFFTTAEINSPITQRFLLE